MAPQSITTNGPSRRALAQWIASADASLPVPVSPSRRTVASLAAAFPKVEKSARIVAELPTIEPKRIGSTTFPARVRVGSFSRPRGGSGSNAMPIPCHAGQTANLAYPARDHRINHYRRPDWSKGARVPRTEEPSLLRNEHVCRKRLREVRGILGLYLNPPDHAVVLRLDEKSQIQALAHGV